MSDSKIYKKTLWASALAFVLASSCCWIPGLIVILGGATSFASLNSGLEKFMAPCFTIGMVLLAYGLFLYRQRNKTELVLESDITCPECAFQKTETMPTDACQYFYDCEKCKAVLKPKKGDCCVYCSYGTVPCPPIQAGEECC